MKLHTCMYAAYKIFYCMCISGVLYREVVYYTICYVLQSHLFGGRADTLEVGNLYMHDLNCYHLSVFLHVQLKLKCLHILFLLQSDEPSISSSSGTTNNKSDTPTNGKVYQHALYSVSFYIGVWFGDVSSSTKGREYHNQW